MFNKREMTKAQLIAALAEVPDHAELRVFVDEELFDREHNDAFDVAYVDTNYAVGVSYITKTQKNPFMILPVKESGPRLLTVPTRATIRTQVRRRAATICCISLTAMSPACANQCSRCPAPRLW